MGRLEGKVAIVTGAGNGIGRAIAEAYAREGAAVACGDIRGADAEAVAKAIAASGGRGLALCFDVGDPTAAREAVERTASSFGALHIVVSNAALPTPLTPMEELTEEQWEATIRVNLSGAFFVCKPAIPRIRAAGGGSIILVASQMARVGNAGQAAYCASKGGLVQLAKTMALELAKDNIRVNALSPGGVATDRMLQRFGTFEKADREWGPKHPLNRLGRPEEIAAGAVFLASEDASYMTGTDLLIDGGFTAW